VVFDSLSTTTGAGKLATANSMLVHNAVQTALNESGPAAGQALVADEGRFLEYTLQFYWDAGGTLSGTEDNDFLNYKAITETDTANSYIVTNPT